MKNVTMDFLGRPFVEGWRLPRETRIVFVCNTLLLPNRSYIKNKFFELKCQAFVLDVHSRGKRANAIKGTNMSATKPVPAHMPCSFSVRAVSEPPGSMGNKPAPTPAPRLKSIIRSVAMTTDFLLEAKAFLNPTANIMIRIPKTTHYPFINTATGLWDVSSSFITNAR
jgi:hypothetical protein